MAKKKQATPPIENTFKPNVEATKDTDGLYYIKIEPHHMMEYFNEEKFIKLKRLMGDYGWNENQIHTADKRRLIETYIKDLAFAVKIGIHVTSSNT